MYLINITRRKMIHRSHSPHLHPHLRRRRRRRRHFRRRYRFHLLQKHHPTEHETERGSNFSVPFYRIGSSERRWTRKSAEKAEVASERGIFWLERVGSGTNLWWIGLASAEHVGGRTPWPWLWEVDCGGLTPLEQCSKHWYDNW